MEMELLQLVRGTVEHELATVFIFLLDRVPVVDERNLRFFDAQLQSVQMRVDDSLTNVDGCLSCSSLSAASAGFPSGRFAPEPGAVVTGIGNVICEGGSARKAAC